MWRRDRHRLGRRDIVAVVVVAVSVLLLFVGESFFGGVLVLLGFCWLKFTE